MITLARRGESIVLQGDGEGSQPLSPQGAQSHKSSQGKSSDAFGSPAHSRLYHVIVLSCVVLIFAGITATTQRSLKHDLSCLGFFSSLVEDAATRDGSSQDACMCMDYGGRVTKLRHSIASTIDISNRI